MRSRGSGAVADAVTWLTDILLGPVATSLAVIAVATVGLMMLSGRVDWRRGAQVILGCFILFGSSAIAQGLIAAGRGMGPAASVESAVAPLYPPALPQASPDSGVNPFDPYSRGRPSN
jgi:type IV secretory pathway VirB2 component (pilin)